MFLDLYSFIYMYPKLPSLRNDFSKTLQFVALIFSYKYKQRCAIQCSCGRTFIDFPGEQKSLGGYSGRQS